MRRHLFREEAVDHQRARLTGGVVIAQPVSYSLMTGVFVALIVDGALFLASNRYARKETVLGYLTPEAGLAKIFASRGGVVEAVHVEEGDLVEEGDPIVGLRLALTRSDRLPEPGGVLGLRQISAAATVIVALRTA